MVDNDLSDSSPDKAEAVDPILRRIAGQLGASVMSEAFSGMNRIRGCEMLLKAGLTDFLSPAVELGSEYQQGLMEAFWSALGQEVPRLGVAQQATLQERLRSVGPRSRLIISPLSDLTERQALVEKVGEVFSIGGLSDVASEEAHRDPLLDKVWWQYWRQDRGMDLASEKTHILGYKVPNPDGSSRIMERKEYLAYLLKTGQAVEGASGQAWVFPVAAIGPGKRASFSTPYTRYQSLNAVATPEAALTLQLLRQLKGDPTPNWRVLMTNEAVFQLYDGDPIAPLRVIGAGCDPDNKRVEAYPWDTDIESPEFETFEAVSGISNNLVA